MNRWLTVHWQPPLTWLPGGVYRLQGSSASPWLASFVIDVIFHSPGALQLEPNNLGGGDGLLEVTDDGLVNLVAKCIERVSTYAKTAYEAVVDE